MEHFFKKIVVISLLLLVLLSFSLAQNPPATKGTPAAAPSASLGEKIVGSGDCPDPTNCDPYRWEGGGIGVLKDCDVAYWDGTSWVLEDAPDIWEGEGLENDPYKLLDDVKGLACTIVATRLSPLVKIVYWDESVQSWTGTPPLVEEERAPPEEVTGSELPPAASGPTTQQGREIDEVWQRIRGNLGLTGEAAMKIWHNGWKRWEEVYGAVGVPEASGVQLAGECQKLPSSQYDPYFVRAASKYNVGAVSMPALLKAISSYESGINHCLIGPAGEVGLIQFLRSTAEGYFDRSRLVQCCEMSDIERQRRLSCLEENQQGKTWVPDGRYKCTPSNDDRFNLELHVDKAGMYISKKFTDFAFIQNPEERLKFVIASHHLGTGGVKNCIKGGRLRPPLPESKCLQDLSAQQAQLTWQQLFDNMPDTGYKGDRTYKQVMDGYVTKIYTNYNQFKNEMRAVS